ncbi:MFS transporter [Azomonas macrocytogenes]|uniref:MFS family permease n=1 Tax=Azomonas macrocytogenes TaxID=69962 RepID=A0A839T772_AZOMA|nr:MFS transporter [Azomonas macrocytogenes]MBB3104104.1 MFS family permease [Azomonas macrocytogenes]
MRTLLAPIASLLGGVALLLLGHGLLNTLLTLRGVAEGYSTGLIGLMMSGYFLGYLFGTWTAPPLIRRVGHIRAFACCAALGAIAALLHVLILNPWVWLLLRVLYGVALVTLYMVVESWLNARVSSDKRGQVFAIYMLVNLGSLAVAQQLLRLDDPLSFTLFALAGILICSGLMPITLTHQAQPTLPDAPSTDIRQLARIAPLPLAASGLSGLVLGGFWGLAPVYASQIGYDASGVGLMMSMTILGGALLQWPIGRFSDTHDRRLVMLWVVVLAAALAVLIGTLSASGLQLGLMFVWGGLAFSIYSVAVAQMVDQLLPDEILSGSSGLLLTNGLGSAIGPLAAGAAMHVVGPQGLPWYFATVFILLAAFSLYRSHRVIDLLNEPHGHFTPMLRTSHTVLELMPDAQETEQASTEVDAEEETAEEANEPPQAEAKRA